MCNLHRALEHVDAPSLGLWLSAVWPNGGRRGPAVRLAAPVPTYLHPTRGSQYRFRIRLMRG